jgi:cell division protein FtsW (lipid II flippase)
MIRLLLLLLLIIVAIMTIPATRRRVLKAYGEGNWRELRQNLFWALVAYFILSVVVTLYKYHILG